jgi:hypothetical protein
MFLIGKKHAHFQTEPKADSIKINYNFFYVKSMSTDDMHCKPGEAYTRL